MSMRREYTVSRIDAFHLNSGRGGKQETTELGVCATLKEANKLAKSNAREQERNGFKVGRKYVSYASDKEIRLRCTSLKCIQDEEPEEGERWHFRIEVYPKRVATRHRPKIVDLNTGYGEMVRIPSGKFGGLKGARFLFTGNLKTMTREVAQAAACAYGGEVVKNPGGKTKFSREPFSHSRVFDFVVTGKDTVQPEQLEYAALFGKSNLDEKGFFKLLRIGTRGFLESLVDEPDSWAHDGTSSDENVTPYTWTYGDQPIDDDSLDENEDEDEDETHKDERSAKRQRR